MPISLTPFEFYSRIGCAELVITLIDHFVVIYPELNELNTTLQDKKISKTDVLAAIRTCLKTLGAESKGISFLFEDFHTFLRKAEESDEAYNDLKGTLINNVRTLRDAQSKAKWIKILLEELKLVSSLGSLSDNALLRSYELSQEQQKAVTKYSDPNHQLRDDNIFDLIEQAKAIELNYDYCMAKDQQSREENFSAWPLALVIKSALKFHAYIDKLLETENNFILACQQFRPASFEITFRQLIGTYDYDEYADSGQGRSYREALFELDVDRESEVLAHLAEVKKFHQIREVLVVTCGQAKRNSTNFLKYIEFVHERMKSDKFATMLKAMSDLSLHCTALMDIVGSLQAGFTTIKANKTLSFLKAKPELAQNEALQNKLVELEQYLTEQVVISGRCNSMLTSIDVDLSTAQKKELEEQVKDEIKMLEHYEKLQNILPMPNKRCTTYREILNGAMDDKITTCLKELIETYDVCSTRYDLVFQNIDTLRLDAYRNAGAINEMMESYNAKAYSREIKDGEDLSNRHRAAYLRKDEHFANADELTNELKKEGYNEDKETFSAFFKGVSTHRKSAKLAFYEKVEATLLQLAGEIDPDKGPVEITFSAENEFSTVVRARLEQAAADTGHPKRVLKGKNSRAAAFVTKVVEGAGVHDARLKVNAHGALRLRADLAHNRSVVDLTRLEQSPAKRPSPPP